MRAAGAVLAVIRSALAPLADGLGGHAIAAGQHTRGLARAGDLGTDGRGGAGFRVDRWHQDLLARAGLAHRSKRQAYASIAQRTWSQQRSATKQLVLQLRFGLTAVVSGCGFGLVPSSPKGPGHDEAGSDRWPEQETGQKIADLRHRRQKRCQAHQAAAGTAGLLSFALAHVARRRSAANRARKAAAARHRLMCRCHPCQERASQWSRPRSSLARSKHSSIVQRSPAAPASSPSETPIGAKAK